MRGRGVERRGRKEAEGVEGRRGRGGGQNWVEEEAEEAEEEEAEEEEEEGGGAGQEVLNDCPGLSLQPW